VCGEEVIGWIVGTTLNLKLHSCHFIGANTFTITGLDANETFSPWVIALNAAKQFYGGAGFAEVEIFPPASPDAISLTRSGITGVAIAGSVPLGATCHAYAIAAMNDIDPDIFEIGSAPEVMGGATIPLDFSFLPPLIRYGITADMPALVFLLNEISGMYSAPAAYAQPGLFTAGAASITGVALAIDRLSADVTLDGLALGDYGFIIYLVGTTLKMVKVSGTGIPVTVTISGLNSIETFSPWVIGMTEGAQIYGGEGLAEDLLVPPLAPAFIGLVRTGASGIAAATGVPLGGIVHALAINSADDDDPDVIEIGSEIGAGGVTLINLDYSLLPDLTRYGASWSTIAEVFLVNEDTNGLYSLPSAIAKPGLFTPGALSITNIIRSVDRLSADVTIDGVLNIGDWAVISWQSGGVWNFIQQTCPAIGLNTFTIAGLNPLETFSVSVVGMTIGNQLYGECGWAEPAAALPITVVPSQLAGLAADGASGLDITIVAPASPPASYQYTQVWYRQLDKDDYPWANGGTFVGVPGLAAVYNLPGLTIGHYYQVAVAAYYGLLYNYSDPSTPKTAAVLAASDPVIERITADAAATLETITQSNGYYHTVKEVHRIKNAGVITPAQYPSLVVWAYDAEAIDGTPVEHISNNLTLVVEAWVTPDTLLPGGLDTAINRMEADIIRAILTDPRRGGNAIRTKETRWIKYIAEENAPYGAIQITFTVHYRHQRTNPAIPV
jgi:hypothetical protein